MMLPTLLAIGMPGGTELLAIAVIVGLLFGAKRLPELGRNLGAGMREFKKSITGQDEESRRELADQANSGTPAPKKEAAETSADDRSRPS